MRLTLGFFVLGLCTGALGVTEDEVTFALYTKPNTNVSQTVNNTDRSIKQSKFNSTRKTKFIIHGLMGKGTDPWVTNMTQAILSREDANVFAVDWSRATIRNYVIGGRLENIRDVGDLIAQFIKKLNTIAHAQYGDFHLIGHSLGAHVAGFAGEKIPGLSLGRITGLDPAALWFENNVPKDRLDSTDAVFVDAIHTDIGRYGLGIKMRVGDADFFPNGGDNQTGCDGKANCDHERAHQLFSESIKSGCHFRSCPCTSLTVLQAGKCKSCVIGSANMGYKGPRPGDGIYYLSTNGQSPFCKG